MRVNIVWSLVEWRENRATKEHSVEEDAIGGVPGKCNDRHWRTHSWGVTGKSPVAMSAVDIDIINASSLLLFMKCQVHQITWILHAPNSRMVALILKYAIEARIGGWFKPTYWELNQTHMKILTHLKNSRHQLRNWLSMIAPAYDSTKGSSLCLEYRHMCLWFGHMSSDGVAQNCPCVEESCWTRTQDWAGTMLSANIGSYMDSNWVFADSG
jgi:hypothetical protein